MSALCQKRTFVTDAPFWRKAPSVVEQSPFKGRKLNRGPAGRKSITADQSVMFDSCEATALGSAEILERKFRKQLRHKSLLPQLSMTEFDTFDTASCNAGKKHIGCYFVRTIACIHDPSRACSLREPLFTMASRR